MHMSLCSTVSPDVQGPSPRLLSTIEESRKSFRWPVRTLGTRQRSDILNISQRQFVKPGLSCSVLVFCGDIEKKFLRVALTNSGLVFHSAH